MTELSGRPIGPVSSERTEPLDDGWDVRATITLDAEQFGPEALQGLDAFSHVEVVSVFDRVDPDGVPTVARHPRGNPDWPQVGIFAQRATGREPSRRLGVPTAGRAGPDSLGSRARRDRRHTDPGPHAVRGGVRPPPGSCTSPRGPASSWPPTRSSGTTCGCSHPHRLAWPGRRVR